MRHPSLTSTLLSGAAIATFGLLVFVLTDASNVHEKPSGRVLVSRVARKDRTEGGRSASVVAMRVTNLENRAAGKLNFETPPVSNALTRVKLDADDDKLMDDVVRGLISAIDEAMRAKKFARVLALLGKIRETRALKGCLGGGKSGGSIALKKKVLEALGALGLDGVDHLLDLVGDEDPGIAQSAQDLFFKTINDPSLGDYKLAELIVAAAAEFNDPESAGLLYQNIQVRMRPTVGVKTLLQLADVGTDAVKAALPENIAAFVIDANIDSPEKLRASMNEIVDPEDTSAFEPIYMNSRGKK